MGKPVTAFGFNGMNNLSQAPAYLLDDKRRITPRYILNADVMDGGVAQGRGGFVLQQSLAGAHSLAGEEKGLSVFLVVVSGILYRIDGDNLIPLASVGPQVPMNYAEVNNRVFLSTSGWNGVYDLITGEVRSWGLDPPGAPDITLVAGDMAPGKYSLAYTRVTADGRLSGNGPVRQIAWDGIGRGIQLNNWEDGLIPWITQPDGGQLFLANPDAYDRITVQVPQTNPLTTLNVIPPPPFSHFVFVHGRIWGVAGKNLYYPEPGEPEWFKRGNFLPFLEDLVLVAGVNEGIFVNSLTSTWFLSGTDPKKMAMSRIGEGALPGSLMFAQVPGSMTALDGLLRPKGPQMPLPIWLAPTGFVTGTHGGTVTHMTNSALSFPLRQRGAGLFRYLAGVPQVVMTQGGSVDRVDEDLQLFMATGRLCPPAPVDLDCAPEVIWGGSLN